jgi:photosystem II stability/assembly factor-like uncharacterized protein
MHITSADPRRLEMPSRAAAFRSKKRKLWGVAWLAAVVALTFAFCGQAADAAPLEESEQSTYLWRPVAVGAGGFITGYSADLTGRTRVVRSDVYGAYLWLDPAQRWAQLVRTSALPEATHFQTGLSEPVYEIVVAPSDPLRIYMAIKDTVYRSNDRGLSFADTRPSPRKPFKLPVDEFTHFGPYLAVAPSDSNLVFFGTPQDGLWRTEDGGKHWAQVESVPASRDLRDTPGVQAPGIIVMMEPGPDPSKVWAISAGNGVYFSKDAGRNFVPLPSRSVLAPKTLRQGAFADDGTFFGVDSESRSAWRYRDGTWTSLTSNDRLPSSPFAAVAVQPGTSYVWVFTEGGQSYRSRDGGDTWTNLRHHAHVSKGDPPYLRANDIDYWAMSRVVFDPVDPRRMWVSAGTGVYYADIDTEITRIDWHSRLRGIEELVANDIVKPPGHALLLAGWDFGIHVKSDLDAYSTTFGPKPRVLISAQQLAWTPVNPSFIATNASDARTSCCSEDGDAVLAGYSLDGGRSWVKFQTLPHPPGTKANDPWRMSFGTIAVAADDIDNIVWMPTFHRAPFYTKDRGSKWHRVELKGETLPFTGSHPELHYHRKTLAADRVLAGVFYLVHAGEGSNAQLKGLWKTVDGGVHWTKAFEGDISPHSEYSSKLRTVPGHGGHLFFTSGVLGPFDTRLRRSTDGGSNWTTINAVDQVDDIAFGKSLPGSAYPTIFVSARVNGLFGIWRSTDAAASWIRIAGFPLGSLDQVTVIEGDPDVFGRTYVGFKGSGWVYGEPATCQPSTAGLASPAECVRIRSTAQ